MLHRAPNTVEGLRIYNTNDFCIHFALNKHQIMPVNPQVYVICQRWSLLIYF